MHRIHRPEERAPRRGLPSPVSDDVEVGNAGLIHLEGVAHTMSIQSAHHSFEEQLLESIQDELADAGFYARIANEAPNIIAREIIISIVGDEYAHARIQAALTQTFEPLGPGAQPVTPIPNRGYLEDLLTAVRGELEAVDRYSHLAAIAPSREIRFLLTSIMGDEYDHSRIWLALYEAGQVNS